MADTYDEAAVAERLTALGIAPTTAEETARNKKHSEAILGMADQCGDGPPTMGVCLYILATSLAKNFKGEAEAKRSLIFPYLADGRISSEKQLKGACKYLKGIGSVDDFAAEAFEAASGVGIVVTREEIQAVVEEELEKIRADLEEERYHMNTGRVMGAVTKRLPWAEGSETREVFDACILAILGPRTAADDAPRPKKKNKKADKGGKGKGKGKGKKKAAEEEEAPAASIEFPPPEANTQVTEALLAEHLARTGGRVMTRFPPEPNGCLHIGHVKSMTLNFGYAEKTGGECVLRFDDTNPEAEKIEYFEEIEDTVKWMGFTPSRVTCSSDYYQDMFDFAVQLIREDKAYVCHQTGEEISEYRAQMRNSPWRDRPVEESLKLFMDMKKGKFDEGYCTLRLKMDMQSTNTVMRDLIAYRIKYHAHPKAGDGWCIYPSYDFEHCIVDSLEDITHSLCTLEFGLRQESYAWLVDNLGLYRSYVWEYSRLNITHTVISKRKLTVLVQEGIVSGWDDPRLPTIKAMRRRGYTPDAMKAFALSVGITRNDQMIEFERLEFFVRKDLNDRALRRMAVLDPVKVVIVNVDDNFSVDVECANKPGDDSLGVYVVPLTKTFYIQSKDFRNIGPDDEGYRDFFGLTPGRSIRLKYGGIATFADCVADADGNITEIHVEYDHAATGNKKTKTLTWVADPAPGQRPLEVQVREFTHLFRTPDTSELDENWRNDLDLNSRIDRVAYIDHGMANAEVEAKYQFERVGFFCVDPDTQPGHVVFNKTVDLRGGGKR